MKHGWSLVSQAGNHVPDAVFFAKHGVAVTQVVSDGVEHTLLKYGQTSASLARRNANVPHVQKRLQSVTSKFLARSLKLNDVSLVLLPPDICAAADEDDEKERVFSIFIQSPSKFVHDPVVVFVQPLIDQWIQDFNSDHKKRYVRSLTQIAAITMVPGAQFCIVQDASAECQGASKFLVVCARRVVSFDCQDATFKLMFPATSVACNLEEQILVFIERLKIDKPRKVKYGLSAHSLFDSPRRKIGASSSLFCLPNFEFWRLSCWLEAALNSAFGLRKFFDLLNPSYELIGRVDIFVAFQRLCRLMRLHLNFGHGLGCMIPAEELQQIGVYPIVPEMPPDILESYEGIISKCWGETGDWEVAFKRILLHCGVEPFFLTWNQIRESNIQLFPGYPTTALVALKFPPAIDQPIVVNLFGKEALNSQCSSVVPQIAPLLQIKLPCHAEYVLVSIVFGNGAHFFSLVLHNSVWCLKNAIRRQNQAFSCFGHAWHAAKELEYPYYDNMQFPFLMQSLVYECASVRAAGWNTGSV
jgi:hypothetical protein